MKKVGITEFRNNIKKYSELAQKEDFEVVNRGRLLFIVKSPKSKKIEAFEELEKLRFKGDTPYEDILKKRIEEL